MLKLTLITPTPADAARIAEYRAAFAPDRPQVTPDPDRIPGLDHLEDFRSVAEWLCFCASMRGKISWYLTLRESDGKMVGCCCLRHSLQYDDDDPDFASHIGYSIHPDERGQGYGREQLRLALHKAKALGLDRVRVVCRDTNIGSRRVIEACGGVFAGAVRGEESGMTVLRYDIRTG